MKFAIKHTIVILSLIILLINVLSVKHTNKQFPVQRPRVNLIYKSKFRYQVLAI